MQEVGRTEAECRRLLASFLSKFSKGTTWWYPIYPNVENNLSYFLGLDFNLRYIPLLCECGLMKERVIKTGEKQYLVSQTSNATGGYSWNSFFTEYNLDGCEITTSYVKQYGRQITFLRIGMFKEVVFNPIEQYRWAIPKPSQKWRRLKQLSLSRKLASILPLNIENDEEVNGDEIIPPKDKALNLASAIEFRTDDEPGIENLKMLLKNNFFAPILKRQSDFAMLWDAIDTTKLAKAVFSIIESLQKYFCEKGKAKRSLILAKNSSDGSAVDKEELELKQGLTARDFPVLNHFCIPLEQFWITGLLRDVLKLSKSVVSGRLLNFKQYNDCEVTLVPIPTSVSYYRFERNMKGNSWFSELLMSLSNSRETSLTWLLKSLTKLQNEEFITAAEAAGLLLNGKVMDAESAAAMWEEANINCRQQRTILRHLACYFGRRLTVPLSKIRELEEGALMPTTCSVDLGGKKINYWYKDVEEALTHRLHLDGKAFSYDYFTRFDSLDVVVGGDHGQRKFRMVMRVIYRNKADPTVPPVMHMIKIGHIDCTKDTREILEQTIGIPINEGIKKIFSKVIVITRCTSTISYLDESPIQNGTSDEQLIALPVAVFLTGDLAFLSTVLGKENMSTAWCPWCILSKSQWSASGHQPGELWTIDKIIDVRGKIDSGELKEEPEHQRGCTKLPLFDSIPIANFIVPVLHILIGVGNALVNCLYEFVDERIEKLPEQLIIARNNINTAEINVDEANRDFNDWLQNDGITLSGHMIEKSNIIQQLKARNEDGTFVVRDQNMKKELNARKSELHALIKRLQAEKKEKTLRLEGLKKLLRTMSDKKRDVEKNLGKVARPIWEQIEEDCFVKFGIERPYYHGGKYNGKATIKLLNDAPAILGAVKDFLLTKVPQEARCSNEEVAKQLNTYVDFFTVFDTVFSNSRTAVGKLSEVKEEETYKAIQLGLKMWRDFEMNISPKLHVLEDHLFSQLSLFQGLGDYSEDFVEQAHQIGMREEARTFAMRDRNRIALIHCRNEHKRSLPAVKEIQAAVAEKTSRKRKQPAQMNAKERQKMERNKKRSAALTKVENENQTFRSGRQQNKDEARANRDETNINN
jgi:hypothetical protein